MSIRRLCDCPAMPWKNGMGRMRELAIYPVEATMDDFHWRVSVAEVDSAAPFSSFAGIDRYIALLSGDGFTMTLDERDRHTLTVPFEPYAFSGESTVNVALRSGATRDFNLMLRRTAVAGELERWHNVDIQELAPDVQLIYCARGAMECPEGPLVEGDVWQPAQAGDTLRLDSGAVALAVRVRPRKK